MARRNETSAERELSTAEEREDGEDEASPEGAQDRHFVTALARGLEVLSAFRSGDTFLANHEIAERCGLPKSTVTRLTYTLTKLGYLHVVPDSGKYRLGTATGALGSAMLSNLDVRQVARPFMQRLAVDTGAVVAMSTRDRLSMLYLECCRSTSIVTLSLDVGSRIALGTSAAGRVYLASLPAGERAEVMERIRALDEGAWPAVEHGIASAMEELRTTGCVTSLGEWVKEVHGIATSFTPGRGLPAMAISVAGPAQTFSAQRMREQVRPLLIETVREIERTLGQQFGAR
ncbi:IclR family transcriptional regulator [Cupriavidus sp. 2TAF22]|uniref:IclR family transcriptional regulator n=1 Tax=unclassified Cupriavidus TaxID=2640874 RepID=UPI003F91CB97